MTEETLEAWLQCERRAWLERARPDLRAGDGGLEQYLRVQRADLRRAYAAGLTRDGERLANARGEDMETAPGWVSQGGATVITDVSLAGVTANGVRLRARIDVLRRVGDGWGIETIAAGTRARPHHVRRLAFARLAAASLELPIRRSSVVHVARDPSAGGSPFRVRSVGASTREAEAKLPSRLRAAEASLLAAREPRTAIGPHCQRPRPCPFSAHCWAPFGDRSVFQVPGLRRDARQALRSAGWQDARALPTRVPGLTASEQRALDDARGGRVRLDVAALRAGLRRLTPPIAFLDMEFATPAVPWLPGMVPFQPLPFQFSVEIEDGDGGVRHLGHLQRRGRPDPRPAVAEALAGALRGAGSVVVYDASAERRLLEELADAAPGVGQVLQSASDRIWDLLEIVRGAVRHPGFGTGWGLKRVASTLAPGSYADVGLADGLAAQAAWRGLLRSGEDELAERLRRYCEADSRALLRVVRVLRYWAEAGTADAGPA